MVGYSNEKIAVEISVKGAKEADAEVARLASKIKMYATQMRASFRSVGEGLKDSMAGTGSDQLINKAVKGLEAAENQAKKTTSAFSSMTNVVKGAITAMLTLAALRIVEQFFGDAIKAAQEFRGKMAELNFAESILSQKGMDITRSEMDKFISDIGEKVKYLSTLEVTGIVADVANMGAEFKLAKKDVVGLAEAVAFMQLSEQAFGQEITKTGGVINAALDGRSNYFNKYGINITKTAIKEKAYAMGLAETGSAITKEMSNQAAIALLIEQTSGKFDELLASIEKVNPALANQLRISKTMKDSQLEVGDALLEVKDAWNSFLSALIKSGDFNKLVDSVIVVITALGDLILLITEGYNAVQNLKKVLEDTDTPMSNFGEKISKWVGPLQTAITLLQLIFLGFTTIAGAIVTVIGILSEFFAYATGAKTYEEAGAAIGQHFADGILKGIAIGLEPLVSGKDDLIANRLRETMELINGLNPDVPKLPDTPTASAVDDNLDEINAEMQEKLDKFNQEILEAQIKLQQDMEDAAIDLGRRLYDITVEYEQKRADAYREYASKIADINRAYADKIADINAKAAASRAKAQADEMEREREFQNKLKEMKEDFLMDLDDALQARDARQILKLIKQYNLEVSQAKRKHELDQENAKKAEELRQKEFDAEREAAERERQAALAEAQQKYADKLAELAADEQAEREAAQLKYDREIEDLERQMQNRLEIIAANLAMEYATTAGWLEAIVNVYRQYYAEVSQIYAAINAMIGGGVTVPPPIGGGGGGGGMKKAEGGTVFANRPTTVTFGEAGMEMATFVPLGRTGQDVNKVFSALGGSGNGGGNGSGKVSIELLLSPDLESRIVKNALNKTAEVFTRVQRTKA